MVAVRVAYSRVRAHSRRSSSKRCNSSLVRPVAETRVTVVVAEISAVVTEVALVVTEAARVVSATVTEVAVVTVRSLYPFPSVNP